MGRHAIIVSTGAGQVACLFVNTRKPARLDLGIQCSRMSVGAQVHVNVDFLPLAIPAPDMGDPHDGDMSDADFGPTLIYTPEGLYEVPDKYVLRDHNEVLSIGARAWRTARSEHRVLSAASFLQGRQLTASSIVCVADREKAGGPSVLWFVRLAIDGGNTAFEEPFGSSFLWQLPHGVSIKIMMALEQYERDNLIEEAHGTELLRSLACSQMDFKPADWPSVTKVEKLQNYYDTVFAMACAPCSRPLRSWSEATVPQKPSFARPLFLQPTGKRAYFNSSTAPDDAMTCIMEASANRLVDSPHGDDFQELLKLRLVCKSWHHIVDSVSTNHYNGVLGLVKSATRSGRMPDIIKAREAALGSGLPTLAVIQDSVSPVGMLNYMRVKSVKRPGSHPPPADAADNDSPREEGGEPSGPRNEDLENRPGCGGTLHPMENALMDVTDAL